jgi:hypothetical protein
MRGSKNLPTVVSTGLQVLITGNAEIAERAELPRAATSGEWLAPAAQRPASTGRGRAEA